MKEQNLFGAIESIIDAWDDWDAEASQAAQQEQNQDAWRFVMRDHLRNVLQKAMVGSVCGSIVERLRAMADSCEQGGLMGFAIVARQSADEIEHLRQKCEQNDQERRERWDGQADPHFAASKFPILRNSV